MKVKSVSRAQLLATPWTAAYQAPPSMGFSRQGYWSGLPLPSPMHKSESEVAKSCPTLRDPHGLQRTRLLHPWDFPGKGTGVGCHGLLNPYHYNFVYCFLSLYKLFIEKNSLTSKIHATMIIVQTKFVQNYCTNWPLCIRSYA